jgi:hypothetical protein
VARSNLIASTLVKSCSRFGDGMVYFSYPSSNYAWRRPGRDAPEVTCVAKMLRHRRVFYPFPKDRMREDVCDSVRQRALGFTPHGRSGTDDLTCLSQTGGREAVGTPVNFFQQTQAGKPTSDITSAHAGTIQLYIDFLRVGMLLFVAAQAPSHGIAFPGCQQELLGCEGRIEVAVRTIKGR